MNRDGFTRVPNAFIVLMPKLQPASIKVFLALCYRANNTTNKCHPSWKRIAEDTNLSRSSVFGGINQLKNLGLIEVKYRLGTTSIYRVIHPQHPKNEQSLPEPVQSTEPLPVQQSEPLPFKSPNLRGSISCTPPVQSAEPKLDSRTKLSNKTKEPSEKKCSRFSVEERELAKYLFEKIKHVAPRLKKPDLKKWTDTIRLMRERDEIPLAEIRQVFDCANQDEFWKTNILSPTKLRKQYATLQAQMSQKQKGITKTNGINQDRFTYDPATAGQTTTL